MIIYFIYLLIVYDHYIQSYTFTHNSLIKLKLIAMCYAKILDFVKHKNIINYFKASKKEIHT